VTRCFRETLPRGKGQPTPSTVHVVGDRIYFWRYDSGDIGCIDTRTGESVLVEAPIQVLSEKAIAEDHFADDGFQFEFFRPGLCDDGVDG
jgi:hypothetical protein